MIKLKTNTKNKFIKYLLMMLLFLSYIIGLVFLNMTPEDNVPTAASKLIFSKAHIVEILSDDASTDYWTEGRRIGTQLVKLKVDTGKEKGKIFEAVNYLNAYANVDLKEGSSIIVQLDYNESNIPYIVNISNHNRMNIIWLLIGLFSILLIILGGKKGVAALLGLIFTIISIWFLLIPLIQRGINPLFATTILITITAGVSLWLINGFSYETICATLGCIAGVLIAGICASIAGYLTPINGFNTAEAETLVLIAKDEGIQISGLLVSGILISSLGAVMDISMTITSSIFEIHNLDNRITIKKLFNSGMNIGKDAMGTMANTLILAFAGASLNMLILFRIYDYPYIQIFNSDMLAIEFIQGISGSIGIILTVPLVAILSAFLCKKKVGKIN